MDSARCLCIVAQGRRSSPANRAEDRCRLGPHQRPQLPSTGLTNESGEGLMSISSRRSRSARGDRRSSRLLLHGFSYSIEAWRRTGSGASLGSQGRRVIGIDPRGHGRSGKPHRDPAAYGGDQLADDVLAVLDAVGVERTAIMGYSMGGRIAMNLWRAPQSSQLGDHWWLGPEPWPRPRKASNRRLSA